jgi:hypothetical protein
MFKKQDQIPIKRKHLNDLKVKRSIDKTTAHDSEIKKLQKELDYFDFGIV